MPTQHRPLLKAAERAPDPSYHTAAKCASLIRAGDSQPGVMIKWFDPAGKKGLFVYGAHVEMNQVPNEALREGIEWKDIQYGDIITTRDGAILIKTASPAGEDTVLPNQGVGLWISHARLPMPSATKTLPAKLPAVEALTAAGLDQSLKGVKEWSLPEGQEQGAWAKQEGTFQEVWVEKEKLQGVEGDTVAYVWFDF